VVVSYWGNQSISRVSLLTDGAAKGTLDFFAINEAGTTVSLDGRTPTVSMVLDGSTTRSSIDFPAVAATKMAMRWTPATPNDSLNVRELASFGDTSLNNYEVALKPEAVAAYDPGARTNGTGKDGKDPKEIAQGPQDPKDPAEVADFRGGSPYLPGALGFPPNVNGRIVRFLSQ